MRQTRSMKAIVFQTPGKALDVLTLRDVPIPAIRRDEVLVKMEARPIQPSDFMFIAGHYRFAPQYPQIAGLEGCGTVVAGGEAASMTAGTRVTFRAPGAWAEFAAVPLHRLHVVPDGIGVERASQFTLNPVTAWALLDEVQARPHDWIAVNAGTSTVAGIVMSLARARGIGVVRVVRPRSSADDAFTLVADAPALADKVIELTGGARLAGLLDSVGGSAIGDLLPALRAGAMIVSYGMLGTEATSMPNAEMIYRNLTWKGFGIDHWLVRAADRRSVMVNELWDAIRRGILSLPVRSRYGIDEFGSAIGDALSGSGSGKVLLVG